MSSKTAVHDALSHHLRLSPDVAGPLRQRGAASGLDPGEVISTAAPETLAGWILAAMAPDVSAARAANDYGALRCAHGSFREFLTGVFETARGPEAVFALRALTQSDVTVFRDRDGSPAAELFVAAHSDHDPGRLDPCSLVFSAPGASGHGLRRVATLPGHALAGLASEAAGIPRSVVESTFESVRASRTIRRAEGHQLVREGVSYG